MSRKRRIAANLALVLMGVVLDAQQRHNDAETYYQRALKAAPRSPQVLNNAANHFLAAGNRDRARELYLKTIAIEAGHVNANLQLAQMSVDDNQGRQALSFLNRIAETAGSDPGALAAALKSGFINEAQAHAIEFKRPMLNPESFWVMSLFCFTVWWYYAWRLNRLGLERDKDSSANTPMWIKKFENFSGPGIVVYALTMTAAVIYWVMSLDPTWYSSVYGLLFLVGQGYSVLALSIIVSISLSKAEPFKTILRQTEQHDLGKFTFAFVMLNIYLAFSQFLIIWSGNLPEEIPWYLDRIRGHWGVIITLDFMFHWLIPFTMLLSRDIKRNKKRLIRVCQWMIFAKAFDLFWLIEPNFKDAARNLHFSWGILEYVAVPVALVSFWVAFYCTRLKMRPLVQTNDPHLAEILEPEHAHA